MDAASAAAAVKRHFELEQATECKKAPAMAAVVLATYLHIRIHPYTKNEQGSLCDI